MATAHTETDLERMGYLAVDAIATFLFENPDVMTYIDAAIEKNHPEVTVSEVATDEELSKWHNAQRDQHIKLLAKVIGIM